MRLPAPTALFPRRSRGAVVRFWIAYWGWFFALLPWMLLRQIGITVIDWWFAWRTRGRTWTFLDGDLAIGFVGGYELLVTAGMFGERFTWLRWRDVAIDPGPARTREAALAGLAGTPLAAVICTHFHEEHIGNAAAVAAAHRTAVQGAPETLAALRDPPTLPAGRALLMGQAEPAAVELVALGVELRTPRAALRVIATPGHCRGHVALFEAQHGILFAGDAFLDELFTSPNADSDSTAWIATLETLAALPIRTLVGAHGAIISVDPAFAPIPGVVRRADPAALIRDKLDLLRWAAGVVAEGEVRGHSYSVIEACLFPWQRSWSWRTWFHDEGFRLLTCGEFSRTHLVRSLSRTPAAVPVRFPAFLRVATPLARLGPELLRVHVLASRLEPVAVIAGSILLSAGLLLAIARRTGLPDDSLASQLAGAAPWIIAQGHWAALAVLLTAWTMWWSVVGGAITRRMGLALAGVPAEPWTASLRWCLRPAMLVPSGLASLCLLAVAVAARWPLLLIAMPPTWLVAGVLYGALCHDPAPLPAALREVARLAARPGPFLRRQGIFLLGFAASTGTVYLAAGAWCLIAALLGGGWSAPLTLVLAAPALVYALGYTTANLKSLQLWLHLRRDQP